jgi:hypothetical protein
MKGMNDMKKVVYKVIYGGAAEHEKVVPSIESALQFLQDDECVDCKYREIWKNDECIFSV